MNRRYEKTNSDKFTSCKAPAFFSKWMGVMKRLIILISLLFICFLPFSAMGEESTDTRKGGYIVPAGIENEFGEALGLTLPSQNLNHSELSLVTGKGAVSDSTDACLSCASRIILWDEARSKAVTDLNVFVGQGNILNNSLSVTSK